MFKKITHKSNPGSTEKVIEDLQGCDACGYCPIQQNTAGG